MSTSCHRYRFQAAVERQLSLLEISEDGHSKKNEYCVAVITECDRLNEYDVVMDFRFLEDALTSILESLERQTLQVLGVMGPTDIANEIAVALAPSIDPHVKLAAVYLEDQAGFIYLAQT